MNQKKSKLIISCRSSTDPHHWSISYEIAVIGHDILIWGPITNTAVEDKRCRLLIKPSTQWDTSLLWGLSDGDVETVARNPTTQNIIVVLNGWLPADSPVLIQSGFAMLAIAKISAARNRHPEMIVSLSISPAEEAVNDFGAKCGGRCPNVSHRVGCYQSNLAPFNRSLLLWFCCAFCSNVSSFASSKREPPATKSITSQMLPHCSPVR